ncbi:MULTISPECIES: hypothetical protein [unclassified Pseudomonas]|uniref:hypothetical protein n=1 Tax=unclassified Pseudomonas TaxID=196821 RepID=UPI00287C597A|nr:hypothetical protein [Pseudomonas sp. HTZ1]MDS9592406.1 hypothetical protein [Pseudomonas sp. HTZ1]HBO6811516.1 hypothetical protein [Pseudomonas aeruginosa]
MSVKVEHLTSQSEESWTVRFGIRRVQFRHERCAREFAAKLKERIEAPHSYPRMVNTGTGWSIK